MVGAPICKGTPRPQIMAATAVPVVGSFGGGAEDIDELFGDIDWATANFTELEAKWRAELDTIEKVLHTCVLNSGHFGRKMSKYCWRARRKVKSYCQPSMKQSMISLRWKVSLWTTIGN